MIPRKNALLCTFQSNPPAVPRFRAEWFISRRIASRASSERVGVMTRIAAITVGIGMAVMIVSMAVITGFREEISANLAGFGGHVQVISTQNSNALETTPIERDDALAARIAALPPCRGVYPFAVKGGIIRTDQAMQGVMLKGVDGGYDWSFFKHNLVEGALPRVADSVRNKDILISASLADMMLLAVDDRVEMIFIREGQAPRRDRFKVSGIYSTGFEELDKTVVMTDLRSVQRLNGWDSLQVTGYEAMAADMEHMEALDDGVYTLLLERMRAGHSDQMLMTIDIARRFPGLFDWLKAHNVNAAVIITIMLTVALLNMISALLIIILERTRMIGTLKALGMNNRALQRIFIVRSAWIVLRGMFWGNVVGLGACAMQLIWHPFKLDRVGYFLSEVPISLHWGWWTALNVGSFLLIVLLMALPVMIISFMKPDTTLRFR